MIFLRRHRKSNFWLYIHRFQICAPNIITEQSFFIFKNIYRNLDLDGGELSFVNPKFTGQDLALDVVTISYTITTNTENKVGSIISQ
jgi:hypothetical protein